MSLLHTQGLFGRFHLPPPEMARARGQHAVTGCPRGQRAGHDEHRGVEPWAALHPDEHRSHGADRDLVQFFLAIGCHDYKMAL